MTSLGVTAEVGLWLYMWACVWTRPHPTLPIHSQKNPALLNLCLNAGISRN